jgi:recombination protein RecR
MSLLPKQITDVIHELSKLPGIGPKSAERLTFHMLRSKRSQPEVLGKSLMELKNELRYCTECAMICTTEKCAICMDPERDAQTIVVVENPLDIVAFEKNKSTFVYHVLHGVLSPIDGLGPEQLKLAELVERVQKNTITEVIIATNPDIEGEATAHYLKQVLSPYVATVSRLAHGLPMGADIEFADQVTLLQALQGRRNL